MDLKRFFSDEINFDEKIAVLSGDEFYHAVKVTRHRVGYKLIVADGDGFDYYCEVTEISSERLYARIERREANDAETKGSITLFIGVNKDIDTVVQKAVELGVKRIVPFKSNHSNVEGINTDRLNKIVSESAKQCGRCYKPVIEGIVPFAEALRMAEGTDILFFYEHEWERRLADVSLSSDDISVFIGSEGGFSVEEVAEARARNAEVLSMGKRILRVSTAVVSALTLVAEKIGEM